MNSPKPGSGLILILGIHFCDILNMGLSHTANVGKDIDVVTRYMVHTYRCFLAQKSFAISEHSLGFVSQQGPHSSRLQVPTFQIV